MIGYLEVNSVPGSFSVSPGKSLQIGFAHIQLNVRTELNMTHTINKFSFGDGFPGFVSPLDGYVRLNTGLITRRVARESRRPSRVAPARCSPNSFLLFLPGILRRVLFVLHNLPSPPSPSPALTFPQPPQNFHHNLIGMNPHTRAGRTASCPRTRFISISSRLSRRPS